MTQLTRLHSHWYFAKRIGKVLSVVCTSVVCVHGITLEEAKYLFGGFGISKP
jgi:hypothetical protein